MQYQFSHPTKTVTGVEWHPAESPEKALLGEPAVAPGSAAVAPYAGNRNLGSFALSSFAAMICCLVATLIFGAPTRWRFFLRG